MPYYRDGNSKSGDRDIFNERPTREEQSIAASAPSAPSHAAALASSATIHTTLGDMHMRLFPQQAPKAVENFIGHARSGYYDGVIFHRVIPKFMIQTGDPLGDGTGGTSIWDGEFEDEFSDDLRHDRYALSALSLAIYSLTFGSLVGRTPSAWRMQDRTRMGHSSSLLQTPRRGSIRSTPFSGACCQGWRPCTR